MIGSNSAWLVSHGSLTAVEVNRCYYIVICVLALSIGGCVHLRPILGTEALVVMPASATDCHIQL